MLTIRLTLDHLLDRLRLPRLDELVDQLASVCVTCW